MPRDLSTRERVVVGQKKEVGVENGGVLGLTSCVMGGELCKGRVGVRYSSWFVNCGLGD
jgi:hypothetical protein